MKPKSDVIAKVSQNCAENAGQCNTRRVSDKSLCGRDSGAR